MGLPHTKRKIRECQNYGTKSALSAAQTTDWCGEVGRLWRGGRGLQQKFSNFNSLFLYDRWLPRGGQPDPFFTQSPLQILRELAISNLPGRLGSQRRRSECPFFPVFMGSLITLRKSGALRGAGWVLELSQR